MSLAIPRLDPVRALRLLLLATVLAAFPAAADRALPTQQVKIGSHTLRVEVARTDPQRQQGLMHRKTLGRNDGMLFVFDELGYHSMWMMNTYIPLSVAFVDRDGVILNIEDMEPETTVPHGAKGPAAYAIETNKGWFAQRGIGAGRKVEGLPRLQGAK